MLDITFMERERVLEKRTIMVKAKGRLITDTSILHKYDEGIKIKNACNAGCPNYAKKWSCPPYSERFATIAKGFSKCYLLCLSTEMKYYSDIKNKYLAIKAANATLKALVEKCARSIEEYVKGYSLLSGSCRLCKPCQCKNKMPCKHPDRMRYSMEATAINVQEMCFDVLSHNLLWYKNKELPEYTSAVALILFNNAIDIDEILKIISKTIGG